MGGQSSRKCCAYSSLCLLVQIGIYTRPISSLVYRLETHRMVYTACTTTSRSSADSLFRKKPYKTALATKQSGKMSAIH
jgi:hypothetical protein